jgi:UDP-2,3-diacylglucosamine pyrophosphatase LpxH
VIETTMSTRRLIISDLHFGSGDDLLRSGAALERIEPELRWADELVINGDLFELVFASLDDAVNAARPFLALANRHVGRIHYIVGNHDHHLVSLAGDERRFCDVLGAPAPPAFRVAPAERLVQALCPDVEVASAYPLCRIDGMHVMHGHYIGAHTRSSNRRLMDRLAWHLTGATAQTDRLTVADYEALIAPLYELMYEIANLPSGRQAQQRFERWIDKATAIAHAPRRATRPIVRAARVVGERGEARRQLGSLIASAGEALDAMQVVSRNLALEPGTIVLGHTHVPLDGVSTPDGRHRAFNSGSWVWDKRVRRGPTYRAHGWPGAVLRATGDELELRSLLEDCEERDLARMLDIDVGRPRRAWAQPRLAGEWLG